MWYPVERPSPRCLRLLRPLEISRGVIRRQLHFLLLDARSVAEYMGEDVRQTRRPHPRATNSNERADDWQEARTVWRSPPEIYADLRLAASTGQKSPSTIRRWRSAHLYFTLWLLVFTCATIPAGANTAIGHWL